MTNPDILLNPDIREVKIGTRQLRSLTIYPLSIADQQKASGMITEVMKYFSEAGEKSDDEAFIKNVIGIIAKNIEKVLKILCDEDAVGKDILSELTNNQISEIADIVYEVNYKEISKKFQSLFQGESNLPWERSASTLSGDILNTGLTTSTESPISEEGSP